MARSFYDFKVFSSCIRLSDSIELNSSKMLSVCHKANNYAALICIYMEIMQGNIYNFIFLSLLNPKIIQWLENLFSRLLFFKLLI